MKFNPLVEEFIPFKSDLDPLAKEFSFTNYTSFNIFKNFELYN